MVFFNRAFLVCAALLLVSGVAQAQRSGGGSPPRLPAAVGTPTPATFEHVEGCLRDTGPQLFCAAPSLSRSSPGVFERTRLTATPRPS